METAQNELDWIKSSLSTGLAACVELAKNGSEFALRDSKDPSIHLHYTRREIEAFILGAKKGDFDRLLE
ncbi:DUF397 domain-containing protein [Pseudonocardia saturnea]